MKPKRIPHKRDRNREMAYLYGQQARESGTPITAVRALRLMMDETQAADLTKAWSDGWRVRDHELRQGSFGKDGE
ncbi:MAG: hypothetical protein PHC88_05460 [Terrimicrobiaceae bacterium]|nr:hypothetical protein [Terrimicrobiaceae bacterium]